MVVTGILSNDMKSPLYSWMLHDILEDDHRQWHSPDITSIRHYTNFWPCYWSGPYYQIWILSFLREVSIDRCGIPTEEAYSSGHLVLSHFGTCKCSNGETNLSEFVLFPEFWVSNIPRYFCFASSVTVWTYSRSAKNAMLARITKGSFQKWYNRSHNLYIRSRWSLTTVLPGIHKEGYIKMTSIRSSWI